MGYTKGSLRHKYGGNVGGRLGEDETIAATTPRSAKTWFFATLFAVIGFVVGGCVVLYLGFRTPHRPPAPPGLVYCGNSVLGEVLRRWIATVLWAPLAAIACGLGAALLGGILDCVLGRWWARREGRATTDALLRLLHDPNPDIRLNALEALQAFAPRQVPDSVMARLLYDSDQRVRDAAAQAQEHLREKEK